MLRHSKSATLKEKLKNHYNNRNFSTNPRNASRIGLANSGLQNLFFVIEAIVILLPELYKGSVTGGCNVGFFGEGYWLSLSIVLFLALETAWFWWRTYYDVPNWVTKEMKETYYGQIVDTPLGWQHCLTCQLDVPPRSHHCSMCNRCILKRDHHCFFAGACIGYYNQRHFFFFLIYTILHCAFAIYLQLSYVNLSVPFTDNYLTYIMPAFFLQYVTGDVSLGSVLLLLHSYDLLAHLVCAFLFLVWQAVIIVKGQTSYEAWKGVKLYNNGTISNVVAVFGLPAYYCLVPFVALQFPMDGDGCRWVFNSKLAH